MLFFKNRTGIQEDLFIYSTKNKGFENIPAIIALVFIATFMFGSLMSIIMIWYFYRTFSIKKNFKLKNEKKSSNPNNSEKQIYEKYPKNFNELWLKALELQNKNTPGNFHGQNQLYGWLVIIISICYSMPAIQIVMQQRQMATGRQNNHKNVKIYIVCF